jgi:hypothetical protein
VSARSCRESRGCSRTKAIFATNHLCQLMRAYQADLRLLRQPSPSCGRLRSAQAWGDQRGQLKE